MDRTTNGILSQIAQHALVLVGAGMLSHGVACAQSRIAAPDGKTVSTLNPQPAPTAASLDRRNAAGMEAEGAPAKGAGEGIKVHGHWTIEIRNPDGKVQSHREFENALVATGATAIANLLAGQASEGGWGIYFGGPGGPCANGTEPTYCWLQAGAAISTNCAPSICFNTLTISPSPFNYNASTLTLQGTAVATFSTSINSVSTSIYICTTPSVAPSSCLATPQPGIITNFSSKNLDGVGTDPSPVPVSAGQTIAVTVQYSFQ